MSVARVRARLARDPALAAEYRRLEALRDAIGRRTPREAAPQALADRIAALTAPAAPSSTVTFCAGAASGMERRSRRWRSPPRSPFSASPSGRALMSLRTQGASHGVAQSLVSDFARAEIAGQPFDVASSDRHTVKPWLAGRTTVSA